MAALSASPNVLAGRRRAADEVGDLGRADENGVDPGPFEREHLLARAGRQVGDRELAGRHIGQQVEDSLDMSLVVVGLPRREQDAHDDLEPELLRAALELLEVLLVVVILGHDQARIGAGVAGGLGRGVDPEQDRQAGGVAHVGGGRLDGEPFGALLLGRSGRVRVGDERDDRDSVSLGDRLAEAAAACH